MDDIQTIQIKRGDAWLFDEYPLIDGEIAFSRYNRFLSGPQTGVLFKENYLYVGNEEEEAGGAVFPNASDLLMGHEVLYNDLKTAINEINRLKEKSAEFDPLASYDSIINIQENQRLIVNQILALLDKHPTEIKEALQDFYEVCHSYSEANIQEIKKLKDTLDNINGIQDLANNKEDITINQLNLLKEEKVDNNIFENVFYRFESDIEILKKITQLLDYKTKDIDTLNDRLREISGKQQININQLSRLRDLLIDFDPEENSTQEEIYRSYISTLLNNAINEIDQLKDYRDIYEIDPELLLGHIDHLEEEINILNNFIVSLRDKLNEIDQDSLISSIINLESRVSLNSNELKRLNDDFEERQGIIFRNLPYYNRGFVCEINDFLFGLIDGKEPGTLVITGGVYFHNGRYRLTETATKDQVVFYDDIDKLIYYFLNPDDGYFYGTEFLDNIPDPNVNILLRPNTLLKEENFEDKTFYRFGTLVDSTADELVDVSFNDLMAVGAILIKDNVIEKRVAYKPLQLHPRFGRCEPAYPIMYNNSYDLIINVKDLDDYIITSSVSDSNSIVGQSEEILLEKVDDFIKIKAIGAGDQYKIDLELIKVLGE